MPIGPPRRSHRWSVEVPAVMQMEPMAAKMKMKSTTLPKRPFTAFVTHGVLAEGRRRRLLVVLHIVVVGGQHEDAAAPAAGTVEHGVGQEGS